MGTKKMPPPMTLETTMAAASSGPRRRSSDATVGGVTRGACGSFGDQCARYGVFPNLLPLSRPVFREDLNFRVHKLFVLEHLLARLRTGIAKLRPDVLSLGRGARWESFRSRDLDEGTAPFLVFGDTAKDHVRLKHIECLIRDVLEFERHRRH